MKSGLQPGAIGELIWNVDSSMVITLGGDPRATVFSTPNMIMLMERSAREALRPYLDEGEESVGTDVQIQHVSGAGIGAVVRGEARVTGIDGKRIHFDVSAWCGERQLGFGKHTRALVKLERLIENLDKQSQEGPRAMNLVPNNGALPSMQTLLVEQSGPIATVTLNRPRSLNAVNAEMTSDFEKLVGWLLGHKEELRVVLLRGAGDSFCAGDDIKELPGFTPQFARELSLRQAEMYLAWERLPQIVIAMVHGDAMGGGCVAAYSADFRLASHDARFGMPEIKLGWPPGYGIAQLTNLIGKSRALEMCLLGEPLSAQKAFEWGLVHELVPRGQLEKRSLAWAERLLKLPAEAMRQTKMLLHLDEGSQPKVAYRADTEAYIRCLQLDDATEGIRAFIEKRAAEFGRKR
ncbi:MAG: enoyl-CoA hydratase-related protein [Planctomycetaceae bacterium]|jgi:enoyl-CoA hydratase|nr:enoyl-CoA hydratase-related protein [Planctomycetaceae bacterium]MCE2813717.1 enoyl-CoA hydratase-related protein [Planctomycetaceae bacterium]